MKIVSQDGLIDVPYETAHLKVGGNKWKSVGKHKGDSWCIYRPYLTESMKIVDDVMAVYPTSIMATYVMELLHSAYVDGELIFQFPEKKDLENMMESE